MAFFQKRFFYQTKFKPSSLTRSKNSSQNWNQKGFVSLLLLPFIVLMMTAITGLSSLSLGIKNITQAQTSCIEINLNRQKKLGVLLEKILNLNKKVWLLHETKQGLKISLAVAIASGQAPVTASLKKAIKAIEKRQKNLMLKQQKILALSELVKRKAFQKFQIESKKLPIPYTKEVAFYKKALALEKKKVGDKAYIYKTQPDFTERQKSRFLWKMQPFFPQNLLELRIQNQNKLSNYQCTASLTKKGDLWTNSLYH